MNDVDWRTVWREGIAPNLPTKGLRALEKALLESDRRLIPEKIVRGGLHVAAPHNVPDAACAIGFAGWQGERIETIAGVEQFFDFVVEKCDSEMGGLYARIFLNWFDEHPMADVRRELLPEVVRVLEHRDVGDSERAMTRRLTFSV